MPIRSWPRCATNFQWVGPGQASAAAIRYFRRHGVHEATMAGKIHKVRLFQPLALAAAPARPAHDPHVRAALSDAEEGLPRRFAAGGDRQRVRRRGHPLGPATDYAPELLVAEGQLTRRGPSAWQQKDIAVRLEDGQGDGPARHRPERGREGPGGAGGRGRRRAPTSASAAPARSVRPAASRWSRWPSRSRTCVSTCPRSAWARSKRWSPPAAKVLAVEAGRTILLDVAP